MRYIQFNIISFQYFTISSVVPPMLDALPHLILPVALKTSSHLTIPCSYTVPPLFFFLPILAAITFLESPLSSRSQRAQVHLLLTAFFSLKVSFIILFHFVSSILSSWVSFLFHLLLLQPSVLFIDLNFSSTFLLLLSVTFFYTPYIFLYFSVLYLIKNIPLNRPHRYFLFLL